MCCIEKEKPPARVGLEKGPWVKGKVAMKPRDGTSYRRGMARQASSWLVLASGEEGGLSLLAVILSW